MGTYVSANRGGAVNHTWTEVTSEQWNNHCHITSFKAYHPHELRRNFSSIVLQSWCPFKLFIWDQAFFFEKKYVIIQHDAIWFQIGIYSEYLVNITRKKFLLQFRKAIKGTCLIKKKKKK